MKTLLITIDFPPVTSGIGTVFYNLAKRSDNDNFMVLCSKTTNHKDFDKNEKFKLYRFSIPMGYGFISRLIRGIILFIYTFFVVKKENIDLLICGSPITPGLSGFIIKKILNLPYVVFAYGGETSYYMKKPRISGLMKRIINDACLVIVNSEYTKEEVEIFTEKQKNFYILNPGVDTKIFRPEKKDNILMSKYNLYNKNVLLTVARIVERKGHENVIRVLPDILKEFPDLVYLIVGRGPFEQRLKEIVNELKLNDNVIFTGFVADSELPKYYNLCDIFIMLSKELMVDWNTEPIEGFGISFIEASACAKPVIAGKSGGTSDAVKDGTNGFLVEPENSVKVKETLLNLLRNKELACKIGESGRKFVEASFDWDKLVSDFKEVIKRK